MQNMHFWVVKIMNEWVYCGIWGLNNLSILKPLKILACGYIDNSNGFLTEDSTGMDNFELIFG